MEKQNRESWASLLLPEEAVARIFASEKTGKEYVEIALPDKLPAGAPKIGGWHFYMPASCVEKTEKGVKMVFPPIWGTIRFLSPYVRGKRGESMEFPVDCALELLEETFAGH